MKRTVAVILWILVGAAAAGAGVGYFLHQANADRDRLAQQARFAELTATKAKEATEKIVAEANQKMAAASDEITKAKKMIAEQEQDQKLAARALLLPRPSSRALARSRESLSLTLGLSVWIPTGSVASATDTAIIATLDPAASGRSDQWLILSAYDAQAERKILQNVTGTAPVEYLAGGRLVLGVRGQSADFGSTVYLLRARSAATSTHLIWAKTNELVNDKKILETLATLGFKT